MTQLRLSMVVEAIDRAIPTLNRITDAVKGPAKAAARVGGQVAAVAGRVSQSYAGIAAAVGGGFAVKEIVKENERFDRMRIGLGLTEERVESLRGALYQAAIAWRVPLDELNAGFSAMRSHGVPLDEAQKSLDAIGVAVQRAGGGGEEIGNLFGILSKFGKLQGPNELLRGVAILREQMKDAPGEFEDFVRAAAPLLSSYSALGFGGIDAMRDIGATYATIRPGMPNPRGATTAVQNLLELIADQDKASELQRLGVDVLGHTPAEANANLLSRKRLPISEVMRSLLKAYQDPARALVLDQVLDPAIQRALKIPIGEVAATGESQTFNRKLGAQGDVAKLLKQVDELKGTWSSSLTALSTSLKKVGDEVLASPLRLLAGIIGSNTTAIGYFVTALGGFTALGVAVGWISTAGKNLVSFSLTVFNLGRGLITVIPIVYAAARAFAMLGIAFLSTPLGMVVAGLAALATIGLLVYQYWEPISGLFDRLIEKAEKLSKPLGMNAFPENAPKGTVPDWTDEFGRPYFFQQQSAPGGAADQKAAKVGGQIVVRFDNAPPGMRVDQVTSENPGLRYLVDVGYAMGSP